MAQFKRCGMCGEKVVPGEIEGCRDLKCPMQIEDDPDMEEYIDPGQEASEALNQENYNHIMSQHEVRD